MVLNIEKKIAANLMLLICASARSSYYFERYPCHDYECSRELPFCRVVAVPGCSGQSCMPEPFCYSDVEPPVLHQCTQGLPIQNINQEAIRCTEDWQCPMHTRCEDPPSRHYADGEKPRGPRGTCCWDAKKAPSG